MTDIVERLRTHDDARLYVLADLLMAEAADEIERNRAAIAELLKALNDFVDVFDMYVFSPASYPAYNKGRAAIAKYTKDCTDA